MTKFQAGDKVRVKDTTTMYAGDFEAPLSKYCGMVGIVKLYTGPPIGYEVEVLFEGRNSTVSFMSNELELEG